MDIELVDETKAAKLLDLPKGTLKGWRCRGIGPKWVKLGRNVRYDVRELLDFVRNNTRTPSVRANTEFSRGSI